MGTQCMPALVKRVPPGDQPGSSVSTKVYDRTVEVLQTSLEKAKLGDKDRIEGLSRLHRFVAKVEQTLQPVADFDELIAHEHRISPALGGRSAFGS